MNESQVIDEMLGDGRGRTDAVVGLSENPGKPKPLCFKRHTCSSMGTRFIR